MKAYEIIEQIKCSSIVYKASYYFNVEDVTVRVSNHLPKRQNWENNENQDKALFIFTELEMNEYQIEKYLETEFSDITFNYMLVEYTFNQDLMNYYLNTL